MGFTYIVSLLYLQELLLGILVRIGIGVIFPGKLWGLEYVQSRKLKHARTEKYVFLISAGDASLLTPRTWYGSFGAECTADAWNDLC